MAINNTLTLIQAVTVGAGGAPYIEFTAIPQTYTDLIIKLSGRNTNSGDDRFTIEFNNSSSNLSQRRLYGEGTNTAADAPSGAIQPTGIGQSSYTANTFGNTEIYIPNYTSNKYKSVAVDARTENNAQTAYQMIVAGLWSDSSAITSIKLTPMSGGNFPQHSTAYLYGVKSSAVTGTKATGGAIYSDNTYFYHVFSSSSTFTPTQSITADILVIAGGGGGGCDSGAGGGAGGLLGYTSQSLSATGYAITVGAGGASPTSAGTGANGNNSQFASLTASVGGGGGGGGGVVNAPGNAGGSGGGGGGRAGGSPSGGAPTSGQGYAGGTGPNQNSKNPYGGGGGAGGAGGNGFNSNNGAGGIGSSAYSSWGLATGTGQNVDGVVYYAGGGGSETGQYQGQSPWASTLNGGYGGGGGSYRGGMAGTGGGAGGNAAAIAGTSPRHGGSGIVIVRYAK